MNYKMVSRMTGYILFIEAAAMLPAFFISLIKGEVNAVKGFVITEILLCIAALVLVLQKPQEKRLFAAEGFAITVFGWLFISVFGGLPFFFSGSIPNFIDCFFESMSGFTTTGATILTDVEVLPKGLLFWRSFTHWIGGMGVLVFLLALLPNSGGEGYTMHILRAESPGPSVGKLAPKMRKSATILYLIYIGLTSLLIILLFANGMPLFESVCNALSTAGTGGFGVYNDSIAGYSGSSQVIIGVFMVLFGINFSVFYLILVRNIRSILKDEELWVYISVVIVSTAVIFLNIMNMYGSHGEALRHSFFQVSSVISTTGFSTTDFNNWPDLSKGILLILMFIGSSAGSTGGGIKVSRLVILAKSLKSEISSLIHPQAVKVVRMRGKPVDKNLIRTVNVYVTAVLAIIVLSTLFVLADGCELITSFSAVVACFFNVGPGLNEVGPINNYSHFDGYAKIILSFDMLLGRLEVFPILALFSPSVWRGANKIASAKRRFKI